MLIIDCHCHAGRGDGLTGPWDTDAPLKPYLAWADEAGIERTVLFAAFHSDYAVANRQVAQLVRQQPERFYGFAFVHAQRDRGRVLAMVRTAVEEYGFVGIKLHRYDARISREVCDVARVFRLPVLYDVVGEATFLPLNMGVERAVGVFLMILGRQWLAQGSIPAALGLWWLLVPMLGLGMWLYARDGRVAKPWWRR